MGYTEMLADDVAVVVEVAWSDDTVGAVPDNVGLTLLAEEKEPFVAGTSSLQLDKPPLLGKQFADQQTKVQLPQSFHSRFRAHLNSYIFLLQNLFS